MYVQLGNIAKLINSKTLYLLDPKQTCHKLLIVQVAGNTCNHILRQFGAWQKAGR